jgi:hypothetical protein
MADLAGFEPATRRFMICSSIGIRKDLTFPIIPPGDENSRDVFLSYDRLAPTEGFETSDLLPGWQALYPL